ncbi:MAG: 23S rRNA pseudouridine(2604) synthase RluF [Flavobacteriales bacterium]|nr:23S rRNA pseudouridine(2604) synthase RluF [Flavobacteriales bacterium]
MEKKSRINKYLSEVGFCSRREADKLILSGRVFFNGKQAILGDKVSINDEVLVDNKKIIPSNKDKIYIAFNKPLGIVCTTDKKREKNNIIDYIKYPHRIFPVGRLDKNSEGLIFLTNDGDIVNKILRSKNNHQKEYDVTVDKPITKRFIQDMQNGVPILGTVTKKCLIKQTGKKTLNIILTQGLNRQIRRMCEHFGYTVKHLKRVRIMNIKLDISRGKYRKITKSELKEMKIMLSSSTKTHSEDK